MNSRPPPRSWCSWLRSFRPLAQDLPGDVAEVGFGAAQDRLTLDVEGEFLKFGMVRCSYGDDVARESIDLQQQRTDNPFDLAGLIGVATFLRHCVELIEEEDTGSRADSSEESFHTGRGLAEVTADEAFVANGQQRHRHLGGDGFGQGGFPTFGWPDEQDPMPWLNSVAAQEVAPMMLFHKVQRGLTRLGSEHQCS